MWSHNNDRAGRQDTGNRNETKPVSAEPAVTIVAPTEGGMVAKSAFAAAMVQVSAYPY